MSRAIGTVRAVVGLVVVLGLVLGGAFAAGVVGMPRVTGVENRFSGVSDETTTIDTEITVENPNFFAIELGGVTVNYTVELNEVRLAQGTKEGVNLSTGNATLTFRTAMSNEQIPAWWVAHVRDGESSDLVVHARVQSERFGRTVALTPVNREISTDLLSAFNSEEPRPINANQPIVSDPILYVNETSARWGSVSADETPIEMAFVVYNPKSVPYTVTGIGYEITMNGVNVGSGETDRAYAIPPKSTRTVRATTTIDNSKLDEWWVSHLERNQVTELRIDFYAEIELPVGGTVRVPLDALTYTETMETDIFGNKDETAVGGASEGSTPGGGGETTATESTPVSDDDGGATTTPTEAERATESPTPAGTETDDGGLLGGGLRSTDLLERAPSRSGRPAYRIVT